MTAFEYVIASCTLPQLCPSSWTFSSPHNFVLHMPTADIEQEITVNMNRPLSQTAFMQGHLQELPHTLNSSHWLYCEGHLFSLFGRFLLFGCFICEEKMEKR